jgi:hypothetical protein
MVLVGSTLNRLFTTSPILGRDELPLIRVCLPGGILRLDRPSVSVTNPTTRMSRANNPRDSGCFLVGRFEASF